MFTIFCFIVRTFQEFSRLSPTQFTPPDAAKLAEVIVGLLLSIFLGSVCFRNDL